MQDRNYVIMVTDRRYEYLARFLVSEGRGVYCWGGQEPDGIKKIATLFSLGNPINLILPFSISCDEQLYALRSVPDGSAVFGGKLCAFGERFITEKQLAYRNLLEDIKYNAANALPTAEGALAEAIKGTAGVIAGSEVLITGYGAVAKATASAFSALGAKITVTARREEALRNAESAGYNTLALPICSLSGYSVIINTVPAAGLLNDENLPTAESDALILELASGNGNIDRDLCDLLGLSLLVLPGIPGRTAPAAAAEYLKDAVLRAEKSI